MFVLSYFLQALAKVLDVVLTIYMWIVIIRAVISWINPDPYNPIVRALYSITDPVFYWLRRRVPLIFGGIDFSPMLVILIIVFLKSFLVRTLYTLSIRLG